MREIKFRAWNGEKIDELLYNNLHLLGTNWGVYGDDQDNSLFGCNSRPEARLMQFTGLLDKNGFEIYEGDIVKTDSGANMYVCYRDDTQAFVVRFNETSASSNLEKNWKVIGNIYENPELIK